MLLHIKNMVCQRCITVVRAQLEYFDMEIAEIDLGTALIHPAPSEDKLIEIAAALKVLGFELIEQDKNKLIERIRNIIIELVHHSTSTEHVIFSQVLSKRLNKDYGYLSRLFSDKEDLTIEKFIIQQKIEKVKELLQYNELNLKEIAWKMGYSSSSHLSNQFKAITGFSPSKFKGLEILKRKSLDQI